MIILILQIIQHFTKRYKRKQLVLKDVNKLLRIYVLMKNSHSQIKQPNTLINFNKAPTYLSLIHI